MGPFGGRGALWACLGEGGHLRENPIAAGDHIVNLFVESNCLGFPQGAIRAISRYLAPKGFAPQSMFFALTATCLAERA